MCFKLCLTICVLSLIPLVLVLLTLSSNTYKLMQIFRDRNFFLENQSQFFDDWERRPLLQKHKFYLFNITNGDRFLQSATPMTIEEVGPFAYYSTDNDWSVRPEGRARSLNLKDLRFSPEESVADQATIVHTLNIPLIRNLSCKSYHFLESSREDLVHETTVRDVLREIVDRGSLRTLSKESSPETTKVNDVQNVPKEHRNDAHSIYLQSLRNEICTRLFRVARFVNPFTGTFSRLSKKSSCDCLTVIPNDTDYRLKNIRTIRYLIRWDDEQCARRPDETFFPIQLGRYVARRLFWVSSPTYWRDENCIRYLSKVENVIEPRIEVEPISNVIKEISLSYQFNMPMLFEGENSSSRDKVHVYPVLMVVTNGLATKELNSSIHRYLVLPGELFIKLKSNIWFFVTNVAVSLTSALFIWVVIKANRQVDVLRIRPWLRRSLQIIISIL